MTAPMYARYFPSLSTRRTEDRSERPVEKTVENPLIASTPQLYNRYVPSKATKATITPTNAAVGPLETLVIHASSTASQSEESTPSKKRKRTIEGTAYADRKTLVMSGSNEHIDAEKLVASSEIAKKKHDKKEKKHKTRKLKAIDPHLDSKVDSEQDQGYREQEISPQIADSILAKYSVTSGAHRESLKKSPKAQSTWGANDGMDVELANETNDTHEQMEIYSSDGNSIDQDSAEEEELTKAGVEAIFQKYRRTNQLAEAKQAKGKLGQDRKEQGADEEELELHGLEPLPQPAKTPKTAYSPNFDSLPSWLAKPILVSPNSSTPFAALNLSDNLIQNLKRKDYRNALAVQSGVLPLLLPGPQHYLGDLCVSAPTGSGKTLAYILPIVQSLKQKIVTRLRAIVIVPTRELVVQAQEVAQICAAGTGVKIGVAVGNVPLSEEQGILVRKGQKYDPLAANTLHEDAKERFDCGYGLDDALLEDVTTLLPDHVPEYSSNVDLLICTPGRLVDHIRSTAGFALHSVDWLVIDEADKLLDESFQDWVEVLLHALHPSNTSATISARQKVLANLNVKEPVRYVQKVILSATMTRDLSKLASLKFRRPCLIIVATKLSLDAQHPGTETAAPQLQLDVQSFELPQSLTETGIKVWEVADKPLYLLKLLREEIMVSFATENDKKSSAISESDSDSDSNSDSNTDSDSSSEAESDSSLGTNNLPPGNNARQHNVLIFTRDNENATRLRHLLSILYPPFQTIMSTLTKSSATSDGRKILKAFRTGRTKILISSDRASRGLDVENLNHVINYDMPRNVTSYIHRVGRTARAGKEGKAWTLFTRRESKWFREALVEGEQIKRGQRLVEQMNINIEKLDDDTRQRYQDALDKLQVAVQRKH